MKIVKTLWFSGMIEMYNPEIITYINDNKILNERNFKTMKNKVLPILKILVIILLNLFAITLFWVSTNTNEDVSALSKVGSRGTEVRAIQEKLKERGLYKIAVDGIYGAKTKEAVVKFQKQQGIAADGIAGPVTLKR